MQNAFGYEPDNHPGVAHQECKRCGKANLHWVDDGDKWLLCERGDRIHKCNNKKDVDLFDDVSGDV